MRSSLLMTISAQVLALPIILLIWQIKLDFSFGQYICPAVYSAGDDFGFSRWSSVICGIFGLGGRILGYLVLELVILFVRLFAAVPLASLNAVV